MDGDDQGPVLRGLTNARLNMERAESRAWCKSAFITLLVGILNAFAGPTLVGSILVHVCMGGEAVMMGLAWKSREPDQARPGFPPPDDRDVSQGFQGQSALGRGVRCLPDEAWNTG
jgi:hypothetical protein